MKFISFNSLLSPCAWLVKWHNCELVNNSISDITEKFSLFCNFRASHNITAPAVWNWLKLFIIGEHLWLSILSTLFELLNIDYWLLELCNRINLFMNTISNCHIICQCGGYVRSRTERKCDICINAQWMSLLMQTADQLKHIGSWKTNKICFENCTNLAWVYWRGCGK